MQRDTGRAGANGRRHRRDPWRKIRRSDGGFGWNLPAHPVDWLDSLAPRRNLWL